MRDQGKNNHENTKIEKHEIFHGLFRGLVLSWFRDKESFSFPVYPGWMLGAHFRFPPTAASQLPGILSSKHSILNKTQ